MNVWEIGFVLIFIIIVSIVCYACCVISGDSMMEQEKDIELFAQEYIKGKEKE